MLIDFFYTLRSAKLPVSVKEYLVLLEGIDGTVRDTVMYSLAAGEWPEVKAHLQYQLERPR